MKHKIPFAFGPRKNAAAAVLNEVGAVNRRQPDAGRE